MSGTERKKISLTSQKTCPRTHCVWHHLKALWWVCQKLPTLSAVLGPTVST
jgi:hypothetical protein